MPDVKFYAECIRKGDDPEAVLRVALREQIDLDARLAGTVYPFGSQVLGDAPARIASAIREQTGNPDYEAYLLAQARSRLAASPDTRPEEER